MSTLTKKLKRPLKASSHMTAMNLMPQGDHAKKILQSRAEALAKTKIESIERHDATTYIHFTLGAEHFGISYQHAKEVMHHVALTKLPHAPKFVAGVINRRGALLAILDLKYFFLTKESEYNTDNASIIVITVNGMSIGILADAIAGSESYDPTTLEMPIPVEGLLKSEYILGLHHGLTTIINIAAIVSDPQLQSINNNA